MNDKINEFINNDNNLKETFDKLKLDLFYETAHLSDPYEKIKSKSYKEILSYGKDILPILMEDIKNDNYSFTLCLIATNLIDEDFISIHKTKYGEVSEIRKYLLNWWEENKHKYDY
jgi:hypothetical protein